MGDLMETSQGLSAAKRALLELRLKQQQAGKGEEGIELAVGRAEIGSVARTSTYTRDYDKLPGFLTLLADRARGVLVGALGVVAPEPAELPVAPCAVTPVTCPAANAASAPNAMMLPAISAR